MKKSIALLLSAAAVVTMLAGCSSGDTAQTNPSPTPEQTTSAPPEATPAPEETVEPTPEQPAHYRDTMVVYDELAPADHLVVLQNALKFSRDGFYTEDTAPTTQEITYNGETVNAYRMSDAMAMLNHTCAGDLTVVTMDEQESTMTADEFSALYVIIDDFGSGNPPILYNTDTGVAVDDFWYALTAEGEAIFSIVSGHSYPLTDLLAIAGWDTEADYTVCATDKFHIPVTGEFVAVGEIRGTLSGSINGSFGDLPIASGKISDVVIIQPLQEG